jgi:hypothetical protein
MWNWSGEAHRCADFTLKIAFRIAICLLHFVFRAFRLLCAAALGNFTAEARRAQRKLRKNHSLLEQPLCELGVSAVNASSQECRKNFSS